MFYFELIMSCQSLPLPTPPNYNKEVGNAPPPHPHGPNPNIVKGSQSILTKDNDSSFKFVTCHQVPTLHCLSQSIHVPILELRSAIMSYSRVQLLLTKIQQVIQTP
jgi:hypothetical protein